jgi:hypothetical protein
MSSVALSHSIIEAAMRYRTVVATRAGPYCQHREVPGRHPLQLS